jgi:hypothetical protein
MRALFAFAAMVGLAGASVACGGATGDVPVTPPTGDSFPSPLTVPSGLQIKYFAKVAGARVMAMGPDGAVYVSVPSGNKVVRVWDANGDNVADSGRTAVGGLHGPAGLAFHHG